MRFWDPSTRLVLREINANFLAASAPIGGGLWRIGLAKPIEPDDIDAPAASATSLVWWRRPSTDDDRGVPPQLQLTVGALVTLFPRRGFTWMNNN